MYFVALLVLAEKFADKRVVTDAVFKRVVIAVHKDERVVALVGGALVIEPYLACALWVNFEGMLEAGKAQIEALGERGNVAVLNAAVDNWPRVLSSLATRATPPTGRRLVDGFWINTRHAVLVGKSTRRHFVKAVQKKTISVYTHKNKT